MCDNEKTKQSNNSDKNDILYIKYQEISTKL